jgi:predicted nicotinamide N-methyase
MEVSTALIIRPEGNNLVSISDVREIVLPFTPSGPKTCQIKQGADLSNVGVLLWQSGVALADFLGKEIAEERLISSGKRVCELGCGCAPLSSIVFSEYGAEKVVATDKVRDVLSLAKLNARRNQSKSALSTPVQILELEWGDGEQIQTIRSGQPFDVVLAADVIYDEHSQVALVETMIALGGEETVYYLGYQNRSHSFESNFFQVLLPSYGFGCEIVSKSEDVQIVEIHRTKT